MTGLRSAVDAALSGVDAYQTGANTVSNNISNETTPGYAVRSLAPQTAAYGSGQAGSGVLDPATVNRAFDKFAASRVFTAQSHHEAAKTLSSALSNIDQALTGNGDVHKLASSLFSGFKNLASDPTNQAQAGTVISDAQNLIEGFHSAAQSLIANSSDLSGTIHQQVQNANNLLSQIATINKKLQADPGTSSLLDQQQQALTSLSQYVNVSTTALPNGGVRVMAGSGAPLVDRSGAQLLQVHQPTPSTEPTITAGTSQTPVSLRSTSGSLGGALNGFAETSNAIHAIDWFAGTLAGLVNTTQAEGLNSSGAEGKPLFTTPSPTVIPSTSNTGTATLSATVTNAAALPSNGQGYTLTYSGSSWTATVPGTNQSYNLGSGATLTLNGMQVAVSGTAAKGDSFRINPEPDAAANISLTTMSPAALAAADPYSIVAGSVSASGKVTDNNAGTATSSGDSVVSSPASSAAVVSSGHFGQQLTLTFTSSSTYQIIDSSSGATVATGTWSGGTKIAIPYPSTSKAAGKYWQASLSGKPAAGDQLTIQKGGLNSGSNASRLGALWSKSDNTLPGGSLQGAILSLSGQNGARAAAAKTLATDSGKNLSTAQSNLSKIAGVNQDHQAVELTQYQQAYAAAAKVISTANTMFQSLIQAAG